MLFSDDCNFYTYDVYTFDEFDAILDGIESSAAKRFHCGVLEAPLTIRSEWSGEEATGQDAAGLAYMIPNQIDCLRFTGKTDPEVKQLTFEVSDGTDSALIHVYINNYRETWARPTYSFIDGYHGTTPTMRCMFEFCNWVIDVVVNTLINEFRSPRSTC